MMTVPYVIRYKLSFCVRRSTVSLCVHVASIQQGFLDSSGECHGRPSLLPSDIQKDLNQSFHLSSWQGTFLAFLKRIHILQFFYIKNVPIFTLQFIPNIGMEIENWLLWRTSLQQFISVDFSLKAGEGNQWHSLHRDCGHCEQISHVWD